jgi:ankyrin repeat protein
MLLAAEKGDTAAVLSYLEQGIDVNAQDEFGLTALLWAAKRGDLALTTALLPYRPDLEAVDRRGRTALLLAAEGGYAELVTLLLNQGASLGATDAQGHTLLHMAAASGQIELVWQILAFESRVDYVDSYGDTPLTLAVTNRHYEAARLLIEQGAEINRRGNEGRTPLLQVVMDCAGKEESDPYAEEFLEELLRGKADVNLADDRGWTPLMRAAHKGDLALVNALLAHGADSQVLDGQGLSAFYWAARGRQAEMMRLLRETRFELEALVELFDSERDARPRFAGAFARTVAGHPGPESLQNVHEKPLYPAWNRAAREPLRGDVRTFASPVCESLAE